MLDCLKTVLCVIQHTGPADVHSFLPGSSSSLPVSLFFLQAIWSRCSSCTLYVVDSMVVSFKRRVHRVLHEQ